MGAAPVGPQPEAQGVAEEGSSMGEDAGSFGGPEVPYLVSPSPVVEDSSCFEISRPSSTPTMCRDLDPSELDDDVGPVVCEVTPRARAPSESS
ncbi:hypothetical protein A2U01_0040178, partial [Trifolium medium]|nr:hypothetical protein [Trifolium medium]